MSDSRPASPPATSTPQYSSLGDFAKFVLIGAPAISIVSATIYYSVFFQHFPGFSNSLLRISDYFDKSVEFIPSLLILGTVAFGAGALTAFFPFLAFKAKINFQNPQPPVGNFKRLLDTLGVVGCVVFAIAAWLFPIGLAPIWCVLFAIFVAVWLYEYIAKTLLLNSRARIKLFASLIAVSYYTGSVFTTAHYDAITLRDRNSESTYTQSVDLLSTGLIRIRNENLELVDQHFGVVAQSKLLPIDERSPACIVFGRFC